MARIRAMRETDLEAVAELERQSFTVPWSERLLEDCLNSAFDRVWVLEDEAENSGITGYCNLRVIAGEGELMRIAVHPARRGQGVWEEINGTSGRKRRRAPGGRNHPGGKSFQHAGHQSL